MTPRGGTPLGSFLVGYWGEKISSFFQIRIDLRHHNAHSRLSPSLAMHKTGQWGCLIQGKDPSAILSSVCSKRRTGLLLRRFGAFFDAQNERVRLGSV